jgi:hypothetical protein
VDTGVELLQMNFFGGDFIVQQCEGKYFLDMMVVGMNRIAKGSDYFVHDVVQSQGV